MEHPCDTFKIDFNDAKICRTCKFEKSKHVIVDSPLKKPAPSKDNLITNKAAPNGPNKMTASVGFEKKQEAASNKEADLKGFSKSETMPAEKMQENKNDKKAENKHDKTLENKIEEVKPDPHTLLPIHKKLELKPKSNTMDLHPTNAVIDTTEQLVKGEKKSLFKTTLNNVLGKGPIKTHDDFVKHTNPNKDELNRVKGRRPSKTFEDAYEIQTLGPVNKEDIKNKLAHLMNGPRLGFPIKSDPEKDKQIIEESMNEMSEAALSKPSQQQKKKAGKLKDMNFD